MNEDKLKEKFPRIFKNRKLRIRRPEILDKIYDFIKESNKGTKLSEIANILKLKISTVRNYITKYLEKEHYVRKTKKYTPPYLMIEHHEENPDFIYGLEKRNDKIIEEKKKLEDNSNHLSEDERIKTDLVFKAKKYDSNFFKEYNYLVDELWKKRIYAVNKMRIGSGANRYIV